MSTTATCGSAPPRRSSVSSTIRRWRAPCPACRAARCGSPTTSCAESGTIGGNIVNASPAADGTPPLIAHKAEVEIAARQSGKIVRRRMSLEKFVTGPGKTALTEGEILVAIECEALPGYGGFF